MSEALLSVRNLSKFYPVGGGFLGLGARQIVRSVDDISFDVMPGQTFGLVGESGCGKSTTAKLLLRLVDPTHGTIAFNGSEVQTARGNRLKNYRAGIQTVFQDPFSSLNPRMNVFDIIAEPLAVSGRARHEQAKRVDELLEAVGLPRDAGRLSPHEFSGGQRQRIAIARALALRPKLLILDEPVSALDVSIRAQILNLLRDLQERTGVSYLLISHDLDIIANFCDHIAVMYLGRIVEQGPGQDVSRRPRHPYTRALFASAFRFNGKENATSAAGTPVPLRGELPSPLSPPPGCAFHPRCALAMAECSLAEPPMRGDAQSHRYSCHLHGDNS